MIAAGKPIPRPRDAKLLVVAADGSLAHEARSALALHVRSGDVIVANDAATIPASLAGTHERTGARLEVRLAGWSTRGLLDPTSFLAVVLGGGDWRTRTEHRTAPPALRIGDRLRLGPLVATVVETGFSPRLTTIVVEGSRQAIWEGLSRHGRPVQYAHVAAPLAMWDVWTPFAGPPAAFEPPSAGFVLDWRTQRALRARGARLVTLTHAAGLSATGDAALDARLPLAEPYLIPASTVTAIRGAARVVAVGTTVVRALEHAASAGHLVAGPGVADQRIGPATDLRVVDVLLTGTHERGTSHYELLRAFASDATLAQATRALDARSYRTHEFGDSMLVYRRAGKRGLENQTRGLGNASSIRRRSLSTRFAYARVSSSNEPL